MIIAVDAMGGDNAPAEIVKGAVKAVTEDATLKVILVGDEKAIQKELEICSKVKQPNISIMHTEEFIAMDDHPSEIIRGKRKSSMHLGLKLVKDKKADGFFTAGNSGAAMAVAMIILGLLEGVTRPAIGTILPCSTKRGHFFMLDVGANVDCRPEHIVTFAIMGSAYAKKVLHINNPTVGLLSNGEEEGKGDMLTKTVYPILKETNVINFIGNVEGKALFKGEADVVVCDGFAGNIALKVSQSVAKYMVSVLKEELLSSTVSKIGALLSKKAFQKVKDKTDGAQYGGAPLLGVKGVCVIGHGSSNDIAVANGIKVAIRAAESKMNDAIVDDVSNSLSNIYGI